MEWLRRVLGLTTAAKVAPHAALELPNPESLIRYALVRSGYTDATDEDFAFYYAAYREGKLNYRDLRKRGSPLTPEEKEELGIKYRGVLTREFWATLNEAGHANPLAACDMISLYATNLLHSRSSLLAALDAGIELLRFRASPMLAGPCPRAAAMNDKRIPLQDAQLVPFDDCTHPDQCACRYQAWLRMMDDT